MPQLEPEVAVGDGKAESATTAAPARALGCCCCCCPACRFKGEARDGRIAKVEGVVGVVGVVDWELAAEAELIWSEGPGDSEISKAAAATRSLSPSSQYDATPRRHRFRTGEV
jgi:hypothetical protein